MSKVMDKVAIIRSVHHLASLHDSASDPRTDWEHLWKVPQRTLRRFLLYPSYGKRSRGFAGR
ncbi:MAG: hypothetical protein U0936_24120 [Planctomycetaceae bacterium]